MVKTGTQMAAWANTEFGTVPVGYRPITGVTICTRSRSNIPIEININSSGSCYIYTPSNGAVAVGDVFGHVIAYIV